MLTRKLLAPIIIAAFICNLSAFAADEPQEKTQSSAAAEDIIISTKNKKVTGFVDSLDVVKNEIVVRTVKSISDPEIPALRFKLKEVKEIIFVVPGRLALITKGDGNSFADIKSYSSGKLTSTADKVLPLSKVDRIEFGPASGSMKELCFPFDLKDEIENGGYQYLDSLFRYYRKQGISSTYYKAAYGDNDKFKKEAEDAGLPQVSPDYIDVKTGADQNRYKMRVIKAIMANHPLILFMRESDTAKSPHYYQYIYGFSLETDMVMTNYRNLNSLSFDDLKKYVWQNGNSKTWLFELDGKVLPDRIAKDSTMGTAPEMPAGDAGTTTSKEPTNKTKTPASTSKKTAPPGDSGVSS